MDGYFPTLNTGPVATDFQEAANLATSFGNEAEKANASNINRFVNEDRFDGIGTSPLVANRNKKTTARVFDLSKMTSPQDIIDATSALTRREICTESEIRSFAQFCSDIKRDQGSQFSTFQEFFSKVIDSISEEQIYQNLCLDIYEMMAVQAYGAFTNLKEDVSLHEFISAWDGAKDVLIDKGFIDGSPNGNTVVAYPESIGSENSGGGFRPPAEEVRPVRMWFDDTFVSKIMKYEIGLVCRVLYVLANLILPGILALVDLIQYTIKQEQYMKDRKVYCL